MPGREDKGPEKPLASEAPQAQSITDLVKRILRSAIRAGASAVHVDSEQDAGRVRFRVDGVLDHFMHLPNPALIRVIHRIKKLARLDPHGRSGAQEGQFRVSVAGHSYRMRVETEPAGAMERVRLHITCPVAAGTLHDLGFSDIDRTQLEDLLAGPSGLVVVAASDRLDRERVMNALLLGAAAQGKHAVSIASQVGFDLETIEQVKVDPARGFPVSSALASALEGPAEVIAIELLDESEAAALAVDAAAGGVLIVAGVDGAEITSPLVQFAELGVDRGVLASTLKSSVAIHFVRALCNCAKAAQAPDDIPSSERALSEAYGVAPGRVSVGCDDCRGTGFRGQIPVAEVWQIDPPSARALQEGRSAGDMLRMALENGTRDARSAAHARVAAGETTLGEVERVLGSGALVPQPATSTTVLVVDDTAADRLLMRTLLEQKGYEVVEAAGGPQALALLERDAEISLVLLDLLMPDMNGKEALRRIRGSVRTAGLPVIILTAAEDPRLEVELLESGADDYLGKPFDPSRLAVRVRAVLRRAGAYDPLLA